MKKALKYYCLFIIFVFILIGCSIEQTNSINPEINSNNPESNTTFKGIYVGKPNYIDKRLTSTVVNNGSIEPDGAKLIHKAQIQYAPNKVLDLSFYCIYQVDGINAERIYVKSNMYKEPIDIFYANKDGTDGFGRKAFGNIHLTMKSYKVLWIEFGDCSRYFQLYKFIDLNQYPTEKQVIVDNHPKPPDISKANKIVIGDRMLEPEDANALKEIFTDLKDEDFFDIGEEGVVLHTVIGWIYVYIDDRIYLYEPVTSGGVVVDGTYFGFRNSKLINILREYGGLETPVREN